MTGWSNCTGCLQLLKRGEDAFAGAIDQLLIADLLEPLAGADDAALNGASFHILSPRRFAELGSSALGAMARHNFLSLDIAMAGLFSLQNLKPELRPKRATGSRRKRRLRQRSMFDAIAIDDLSLALDDGELVPLWNIDGLRTEIGLNLHRALVIAERSAKHSPRNASLRRVENRCPLLHHALASVRASTSPAGW